jgi:peptidoglycan/LPS O-acetylase OafA/YrhL
MDRHAFDPLSFTFGAILVTAGLVLLSGDAESLMLPWVGPMVAVGLAALVVFAVRPRRPAPEPDADETD